MTIQELMRQVAELTAPAAQWTASELKRLDAEDESDRAELAELDAKRRQAEERIARREEERAQRLAEDEQVRRTLDAATRRALPPGAREPLVPGPLSPLAHQALAASSSTQGLPVVELPITPQVTPPLGVPTVPAEDDEQDGGES